MRIILFLSPRKKKKNSLKKKKKNLTQQRKLKAEMETQAENLMIPGNWFQSFLEDPGVFNRLMMKKEYEERHFEFLEIWKSESL